MPDLAFSGSEYDAVLRNDLHSYSQRCFHELVPGADFEPNFHHEVIASYLQKTRRRQITRLMTNVPPRHLKSHMVSVAFPTFVLGHDPSARIMCVSYGQDLADKFSRDRLTIMRSPWYQRLFSTRLSPDRQAVSEFVTTEHGYCLATSIGGPVTGLGADYIIIDDPQKPEDTLSEAQRIA